MLTNPLINTQDYIIYAPSLTARELNRTVEHCLLSVGLGGEHFPLGCVMCVRVGSILDFLKVCFCVGIILNKFAVWSSKMCENNYSA